MNTSDYLADLAATPCTCSAIRQASRAITQAYDDALRPTGLRIGQFSILQKLDELGESTLASLTVALTLDRTTLLRSLKPLEAARLIVSRVAESSRERLISLSASGRDAFKGATPLWETVNQAFAERFGGSRAVFLRDELAAATVVGTAIQAPSA